MDAFHDTEVPVGLAIFEAGMNALKHGFRNHVRSARTGGDGVGGTTQEPPDFVGQRGGKS